MNQTLYKKDKKSKIRIWSIKVFLNKLIINSGLIDGKQVEKLKIISKGKNIGKANETTVIQQADNEAESLIQKQRDKGYFDTIEEAETKTVHLPMLAYSYEKKKHKLIYPCFGQPKLDGARCLCKKVSKTKLEFMSRGGKQYETLQNHASLVKPLLKFMEVGEELDGEIYKHGWSMSRIASAVKAVNEDSCQLEYWIYDKVDLTKTFKERYHLSRFATKFCIPVVTVIIKNFEEAKILHDKWVKESFEGIILRNTDGMYALAQRSTDLIKYKEFDDTEFKIVGYECEHQSINRTEYRCIVFVCETEEGETFKCRPKGTLIDRDKMYETAEMDFDFYKGKLLTVRHQGYSDNTTGKGRKVPIFPVGIVIRDYE